MTFSAAVVGASGFTGMELIRLLSGHDQFDLEVAISNSYAGESIEGAFPSLYGLVGDLKFSELNLGRLEGFDLVFLALPHGEAMNIAPKLLDEFGVRCVLDLGADFRLKDPNIYEKFYSLKHTESEWLSKASYGLPELTRDRLRGAKLIACAGCYVTAASLSIDPFIKNNVVDINSVIVDAASGVTGAGKKLSDSTHFASVDENFTAYSLLNHRHTREIEQVVGATVLFTPHLAPMNRGILSTTYMRLNKQISTEDALHMLRNRYSGERFIYVSQSSPQTKATLGSNMCHITARVDERTNTLIVISALDNLVKGASGQAVQCANIALGIEERTGLLGGGIYP